MRNGSVEDILVKPGPRNLRRGVAYSTLTRMAAEAAAGVVHLHGEDVIHRDLAAR